MIPESAPEVTRDSANRPSRLRISRVLRAAFPALLLAACASRAPEPDPAALLAPEPVPADRAVGAVGGRPVSGDGPALLLGLGYAEEREARLAEEAVVQETERRGLLAQDPEARARLAALAERRIAEAAARVPVSEEALRRRYAAGGAADPERDRLQATVLYFREGDARARAEDAAARLRKGDAAVRGDPPVLPPPGGLVRAADLRALWGPEAGDAALGLREGEVSPPVPVPGGWAVLRMDRRIPGPPAPYARVRPALVEAARREARDALRARLLARLRAEAKVEILPAPAKDAADAREPSEVLDALAEGEASDAGPGPVLARVGGADIRRAELDEELSRTFRADAGRFASAEEREAALGRLIDAALLAQAAEKAGLGRLDPTRRARAVALLLADEFGELPPGAAGLDPPRAARLRERIEAWRSAAGEASARR